MFKKSLIFLFLWVLPVLASAGTLVCDGKVAILAYHANDRFMVQLDSMNAPVFFCNPEAEWSVTGTSYKTGPNSCKQIYSTFLAAQMSGKTISSLYFDGDQVPASRDTWSSWSSANIRFYRLQ